jgi:hypothetical protein
MRLVRYALVVGGLTAVLLTALLLTRSRAELAPLLVPGPPASVELPPITVTAGGGFSATAWIWSISPDGSWTYQVRNHGLAPDQQRSGHLTEEQRRLIAALATDPALQGELRVPLPHCKISDGDDARTKVGAVERVASWCPEDLPHIARLRAWIKAAIT